MNIKSSTVSNVHVLELQGRFDAYAAPQIEEWLKSIPACTPSRAVVDLSNVHFVDSTGLAALLQATKRFQQQNGELHLCCLQQSVQIIVELTRFDKVFAIFNTQEEAIERFFKKEAGRFLDEHESPVCNIL